VARAEELLDELTDFLRAVLPRLHSASSTLGRELRIAASYLRLCELAGKSSARIEAALPAGLAEVPFPPGLLLPIIESLLPGEGCLRVAAEQGDRGCRVSLTAAQAPEPAALARVRATLDDLFGARYRLDVAQAADLTTLTLTVPDEDRRI
jgi:LytS/YehU family sensor histidine kinase